MEEGGPVSPARLARASSGPPTAAREVVVVEHGDHRVGRLAEELPPFDLQMHLLGFLAASKRDGGSTEDVAKVLQGDIDTAVTHYNTASEVVSPQKARAWKDWLTASARVRGPAQHARRSQHAHA